MNGNGQNATTPSPVVSAPATSALDSTAWPSGPEIVLNLGMPQGEQIVSGLNNGANGTEEVSISATNPQGRSPGEIMLNLTQNSNHQIILNRF